MLSVLQSFLQQIDLKNVVTLLLTGIGGIITFQISDRRKSKSRSHEHLISALNEIYLPIIKILYRDGDNPPFDRIIENYHIIDVKFSDRILDIPPFHIRQMQILKSHIEHYEIEGKIWEEPIRNQYKRISAMLRKYANYLRRISGYPDDSMYVYFCSSSYSPRTAFLTTNLVIAFVIALYVCLVLINEVLLAILVFGVPYLIFILSVQGKRAIEKHGGIKIILHNRFKNTFVARFFPSLFQV